MWSSRGKWDFYEKSFLKMWISSVKLVNEKDICARGENIDACETKSLMK